MSPNSQAVDIAVYFVAVFLLVGIAGLFRVTEDVLPTPLFQSGSGLPDVTRLSPIWEKQRSLLKQYPVDGEAKEAIRAFLVFGRIEKQTAGHPKNPKYKKASQTLINAMNQYWFKRGEAAYRAFGIRMVDQFIRTVVTALAKASQQEKPVLVWISDHPKHALVQALYAHTGDFLKHAVSWGLINSKNELAGGNTALLRLFFNQRWFRFVTEIKDYTLLMSLEELKALWRWKIEGDRVLSMGDRAQISRNLKNIEPTYSTFEVLGALFAKRGYYREALAMYREALLDEPFDAMLQRNVSFLVMQLIQNR
jgi:hypothetical protein